MICLRCGYCCQKCTVIVVDDPDKGPVDGNLIPAGSGYDQCPHLQGDKPGEYSCAVHDRPWYPGTPCDRHGQIEKSPESPCRMGEYLLKNEAAQ